MTTVTDRISASLHDCFDTSNGNHPSFSATGELFWGDDPDVLYDGMIWDGVSIPSGATYDDGCSIELTDISFGSGPSYTWTIAGIEQKTLTTWTDGDGPPDRTATTATVSWAQAFTSGGSASSPEIKTILQEIEDDASGSGVTDFTLIAYSAGVADAHRDMESYDTTSAEAAFITIEYTAGGGGAPAVIKRNLMTMGVGR